MRKLFNILFILLIIIILGLTGYLWTNRKVISGYAAKKMCSCVFLADRDPTSVKEAEFDIFPNKYTIKYAKTDLDYNQQIVRATFWGGGLQTAVFREGLGCTLSHDLAPLEIQSQSIQLPSPSYDPDTLLWPVGNQLQDTMFENINYELLEKAVSSAFDENLKDEEKRTRAVLVVYKDQIIAESYEPPFDQETLQHGWSMTKSIINALVGILVKENKIDIYTPISIGAWAQDERKTITLDQLLRMSSGLAWNEGYLGSSNVTNMLYYQPDMAKYSIQQPLQEDTLDTWTYSSGTANIVSYIIRQQFSSDREYYTFPYQSLFHKLGMTHTIMEVDASGTFVGSSFGWATARDWARFGLLYLHDGIWQGDTILPEGWVDYTSTPTPDSYGYYGAHFWLNDPKDPPKMLQKFRNMPDIPRDVLIASGHDGQRIFIIPSYDLVIVRLGLKNLRDNDFVKRILEAIT